jgi:hypothetical protein
MLRSEPFFRTFTRREPCDTTRQTEGLFALSCGENGPRRRWAAGDGPDGSRLHARLELLRSRRASLEVMWMDPRAAQQEGP